jgi:hypothetical protein
MVKKLVNGDIIYVGLHVDDLLVLATNKSDIETLENFLKTKFKNITVSEKTDNLDYLGLHITRNRDDKIIFIDQITYINTLLKKFNIQKCAKTPILPEHVKLMVKNKMDDSFVKMSNDGNERRLAKDEESSEGIGTRGWAGCHPNKGKNCM